jgi:hypothetical protein
MTRLSDRDVDELQSDIRTAQVNLEYLIAMLKDKQHIMISTKARRIVDQLDHLYHDLSNLYSE